MAYILLCANQLASQKVQTSVADEGKLAMEPSSATTLPTGGETTSRKPEDQIDVASFTFRPEPYRLPSKQAVLVKNAKHSPSDEDDQQPYIGSTLFIENDDGQIFTVKDQCKKYFFEKKENGNAIMDHKITELDLIPKHSSLNISRHNVRENNIIGQQQRVHKKSQCKSNKRNKKIALKNNIPSKNIHLINSLPEPTHKIPEGELKKILPKNWKCHKDFPLPEHLEIELAPNDPEYIEVANMFKISLQRQYIESICRVENPYLWIKYMLRREENKKLYKNTGDVETRQFHSTKSKNLNGILLNNFDWRKCGSNVGHKYGQGVSFSYSAHYSSTYSDNFPYSGNKMLLVRLLLACVSVGDYSTVLPPAGCDTTTRPDGKVCVKYEDDSYYPEYLISFSGDQAKNNQGVNSNIGLGFKA